MSGSVNRGKNDPSQSLQMISRPLMTPDELKTLSKGHFIILKNGASAVIYSLVETAKENNLKPYEYFNYLLSNMPNSDFRENPERLQDFLSWSDKISEICVIPKSE